MGRPIKCFHTELFIAFLWGGRLSDMIILGKLIRLITACDLMIMKFCNKIDKKVKNIRHMSTGVDEKCLGDINELFHTTS